MRAAGLLLLLGQLLAAQDAGGLPEDQEKEPPVATIQGRVVDTGGAPVADAEVVLYTFWSGRSEIARTTSDADGRYELTHIEDGAYLLKAEKDGYAPGAYSAKANAQGELLQVAAGARLTDIVIRLPLGCSIAGVVTDYQGKPIPRAKVSLFRKLPGSTASQYAMPSGGAEADESGRYRFLRVEPDTWFIAAGPPKQELKEQKQAQLPPGLRTFFPNAADLTTAGPIVLTPGARAGAIDVRLRRGTAYRVSGTLERHYGMHIALWPAGASPWLGTVATTAPSGSDGRFEFTAVESGSYVLRAADGSLNRWGRAEIRVVDRDLADIHVEIRDSRPLKGRLSAAPDQQISPGQVVVYVRPSDDFPTRPLYAWTKDDGSFEIARVAPGKYSVWIPRLPEQALVEEIRFGGELVSNYQIEVAPEEARTLEVRISASGGSLSGTIVDADGRPVRGAIVNTVPDGHSPGHYFNEMTDANGVFLEHNLPAGRYSVWAFDGYDVRWISRLLGKTSLARYAQSVDVRKGERTTVQIRTTPGSVMNAQ